MKTEITRIKLQLKGREIELTATEAREVQKELNRLFEIEKTELEKFKQDWKKDHPNNSPFPWHIHPAPIIIERDRIPNWPHPWQIWCGDSPSYGTICASDATLSIAVGQTQ